MTVRRLTFRLIGAMSLFGLLAFNQSAASAQSTTPCGIAPDGMNVIVSDDPLVIGSDGPDFICTGDAANVIRAGASDDIVISRGGDDSIFGGPGDDVLDGGSGNDIIRGGGGDDRVNGGTNSDRLFGGPGSDIVDGRAGHDKIYGGDGDDLLRGGRGNDWIYGEEGADNIGGGGGADVLLGGSERDVIRGNAGSDTINGGNGPDWIDGRRGQDRCTGGAVVLGCESDRLLTTGFRVTNRVFVEPIDDFSGEPGADYSPFSTITVLLWEDSSKSALLVPPWTTKTDATGQWLLVPEVVFPLGSVVEVIDDATGFSSDLTITITIDRLLLNHNRVRGRYLEGPISWRVHLIRELGRGRIGFTIPSSGPIGWSIGVPQLGDFQQFLLIAKPNKVGNVLTFRMPVTLAIPTVAIDQTMVSGIPGHWRPGAIVDVFVDGTDRGAATVQADGTFIRTFSGPFLEIGDAIRVVERGSGISANVVYESALAQATLRGETGLTLELFRSKAPFEVRLFTPGGRVSRLMSGRSTISFDLAEFDSGYYRYETPEGHFVGEYFAFE